MGARRPRPAWKTRGGLAAAVALAICLDVGAAFATTGAVDAHAEAQASALVDRERAAADRAFLASHADLIEVARRHAARMAAGGEIYHNPNLRNEVPRWRVVGENVGRGPTIEDVHRAFMRSPTHRDNIVDDDYTEIGVGVVASDGLFYVVQVFRRPPAPGAPAANPAAAQVVRTSRASGEARAPAARTPATPRAAEPEPLVAAAPAEPDDEPESDELVLAPDTVPAVAQAPSGPALDMSRYALSWLAAALIVAVVAGQTAVVARAQRRPAQGSVIAPRSAPVTRRAYLARTPLS